MPQREHKPLEISERSAEAALFHNSDHVHIKARVHIALTLLKVAITLFTNITHVSFGGVFTFALYSRRINLDLWSC